MTGQEIVEEMMKEDGITDKFLKAVKKKMKEDNITVDELSKKCGFITLTMKRILQQNIPMRLSMAVPIAKALGMSLDESCGIHTELSPALLEMEYKIQEREYLKADAEQKLNDMYKEQKISKEDLEIGMIYLDEIVDRYKSRYESNLSKDFMIEDACEYIIEGEKQ